MAKKQSIGIALTLQERIIILGSIFEPTGKIIPLRIREDIRKKVDISQEEILDFDIKQEGDNVLYNTAKATGKVFYFDFTDLEKNEIKLALSKLDQMGRIHVSMLDLCDKFNVIPKA